MIDISNVILREIKTAVQTTYPDCQCLSYNPDTISKYPCVTVVQKDNYMYDGSLDDRNVEHHANVVFEVQVYSNNSQGKREEAKKILNIADKAIVGCNFTRSLTSELPNVDRGVYRLYARYRAVVAEGVDINGNTVHQIYRR